MCARTPWCAKPVKALLQKEINRIAAIVAKARVRLKNQHMFGFQCVPKAAADQQIRVAQNADRNVEQSQGCDVQRPIAVDLLLVGLRRDNQDFDLQRQYRTTLTSLVY